MEAYFLDIQLEWSKISQYLDSIDFVRVVNIYHWWKSKKQIGCSKPLIEILGNPSEDEGFAINEC